MGKMVENGGKWGSISQIRMENVGATSGVGEKWGIIGGMGREWDDPATSRIQCEWSYCNYAQPRHKEYQLSSTS